MSTGSEGLGREIGLQVFTGSEPVRSCGASVPTTDWVVCNVVRVCGGEAGSNQEQLKR